MADQSSQNSTLEELEKLLEDEEVCQLFPLRRNQAPAGGGGSNVNESASSTGTTLNDRLNMEFLNEMRTVHKQHDQISLSQPQSQTTKETSSTIHGLIDTIIEQEDATLDFPSPTRIMSSMGTMPKTPTMLSTGTMPKTPTTIDLVSPTIETIDLCSPDTLTTTNTGSPTLTPHLTPQ